MKIALALFVAAALTVVSSPLLYSANNAPVGPPTEALSGFDNLTNGFVTQAQHDLNRQEFDEDLTFLKTL